MSQKNMGRLAQDMKREIIADHFPPQGPPAGGRSADRYPPGRDPGPGPGTGLRQRDGPTGRPGAAIEALNRAAGHVRTEVSKKMHIRKAPRFVFVEDDGAAYAAHINELLRELNVSADSEEESAPEN